MTLPPPSLRGKLIVFAALLILVPGVLLSLLADRSARESLQTVIARELAREALHTAGSLSAFLRSEHETLSSFARQDLMREIRVADIDKRISQALMTLRDGSPARLDYFVSDAEGEVVASSNARWLLEASAPSLPFPDWGSGTGLASGAFVGPLELEGRRVLAIRSRVADPDGGRAHLGVLVGHLLWESVEGILDEVSLELRASEIEAAVMLVAGDGTVIARAGAADRIANVVPDPKGYTIDEANGVIAGAALLDVDVPGWRVLVVEPLEHAMAPVTALTRRLAITTVLALAVALVLAMLSARRVVQPLTELTQAIRGMETGNLGRTTVPVRSEDEVGVLARSFNQMAADLDDAQKQLVEAEKFAFVGELASGVAHEVRTSLGVLRSSAQILDRSVAAAEPEPEVRELVGMIRDEVSRLGRVVDDLLTLDRPRGLHPEPTPISLPARRAAEFVEPQAREKGVSIHVDASDADPVVLCDREALQQVCVNLIVNAVQVLEPGGHVSITFPRAGPGLASFRVADDGPGIPEEMRERIFEPFVTGRDTGVGIGLTFVKRVVHEHGGRIGAEPAAGGGACFEITLPIAV